MSKKRQIVNFSEKVFDTEAEKMPRGAWWWWFWLFFFDNPKNPEKPRQLMILWSAKNVKKIKCNHLDINIDLPIDKKCMDGAVASWYFDGEKMHHNFLLEQCDINVSDESLSTNSKIPTIFSAKGKKSIVRIGKDMKFVADENGKHDFKRANYHSSNFLGDKGYSIMKINHADLSGKVDGKTIKGTAYFQRVFVNAPAIPWYWGIFHFNKGAVMTYTNQLVLGKSIKKDISFFDGKDIHHFDKINVKRSGQDIPVFEVTGENDAQKITFSVVSYAHSSWTFRKKSRGVIPNKLVYNEYPSTITDLEIKDKKTGKTIISSKEIGKGIGNAEHATGVLF